jgi:tetratricopeptide (TPR) repeat protein
MAGSVARAMKRIEAVFARAVKHHRAGRLDQAGRDYQAVLAAAPDHAPSLHLLGALAFEIGQIEAAVNLIRAAITIDDTVPAYHNDLGEALRLSGRAEEAAVQYRAALALQPANRAALNNLGLVEQMLGRPAAAIELYRRAIALAPDFAPAQLNLGVALLEAGEIDAAEAALETARRLDPANPAAALNLANLRQAQDRLDEAVTLYRGLLAADPNHVQALVNLGRALMHQGRPEPAARYFDAALALAPDLPAAQWNAGLCRLLLGDFDRGWAGFAWRRQAGAVPPHGLTGPEWRGEALAGRRLLIHAEQGLGDTIQFIRYLKRVRACGAGEIILLCQKPLRRLLAGQVRVVTPEETLPDWDCRIPLLDLPRLFGTRLATIDGTVPYLDGAPDRVEEWRKGLADLPSPRIGLVWRGRSDHRNDRNRSIPAGTLAPLTGLPAGWVSLQQGATPAELAALGPIRHLGDSFPDLQDAAEAIAALDLVITVDTALAHLAGALGKKVWILLPLAPDWRWLTERLDSPWYPGARLFRQTRAGDWAAVIAAVAAALMGEAGVP